APPTKATPANVNTASVPATHFMFLPQSVGEWPALCHRERGPLPEPVNPQRLPGQCLTATHVKRHPVTGSAADAELAQNSDEHAEPDERTEDRYDNGQRVRQSGSDGGCE